jgi:hypothetical protein
MNVHGPDGRLHCPNCGRDVLENRFRLATESGSTERHFGGWFKNGWNPAQVPFPNPRLVETTDKAAVVLSQVRLQEVI